MKNHTQPVNHPKAGDVIKVEPIRTIDEVNAVREAIAENARNLAIFTLGVNVNLRASDLVKIRIGDVRWLKAGDMLRSREKKTKKLREITLNNKVIAALQAQMTELGSQPDDAFLFPSRKGGGPLTVPTLNNLVKEWCEQAGLKGNFGSHTLRKTFGYIHRTVFKTDIPTLMKMFNHATQRQTLEYLCIQEDELKTAYLKEI